MSKQLTPERRAQRAVARQAAERQREHESRPPSSRIKTFVFSGLALAVAGGSLTLALVSRGSSSQSSQSAQLKAAAQAWRDDVLVGLRPLTGNAVELGRTVDGWRHGTVTPPAAASTLGTTAIRFSEAQAAVARHAPLAGRPRALADFRLTAGLYLEAVHVAQAAVALPASPLRDQLVLQFTRLRDLGDRFFDQADVELQPVLGAPRQIEGVEVRKTAEVPDWRAMGLAVGPPLDTKPARTVLRTYQETRPEQSFSSWAATVSEARVPTAETTLGAVENGTRAVQTTLARRFLAASDALYAAPDPKGDRALSTRVQLGLLVQAEAMRAAEASNVVPMAQRASLRTAAEALVQLGDSTWDGRLTRRL